MSDDSPAPDADRVAIRTLLLSAVHLRAVLEGLSDPADAERQRRVLCAAVGALDLFDEAEPHERELLETPVGSASEQAVVNAWWRLEALAVLGWALAKTELPAYDDGFDLGELIDAGVDLRDLVIARSFYAGATLRPPAEVHAIVRRTTLVRWRLTEWRQGGRKRFDYRGYLQQHPCFRPAWLDGLAFDEQGELAIASLDESGEQQPARPVSDLPEEIVDSCASINLERQVAALWLAAAATTYSQVQPHTVLSELDPPNAAAQAVELERVRARDTERLHRAEQRSQAAGTVATLDDRELVRQLEALEPKLKRFEKIIIPDVRRALAGSGLSQSQRAQIATILAQPRP